MTEREAQLQAQLDTLNRELVSRAVPRIAETIDALNNLMALARADSPGAREVLRDYFRVMDEARAMGSGIHVAHGGPNGV